MKKYFKKFISICVFINIVSCDEMLFVNKYPSYLISVNYECIDSIKVDSLNRTTQMDTLNNNTLKYTVRELSKERLVDKVFHFHDPNEFIALRDSWSIQNVMNSKIVYSDMWIPKSELERIQKRVEQQMLIQGCTASLNGLYQEESELDYFYKIKKPCISNSLINYMNEHHSPSLIQDSLIKEMADYCKYLAFSNHVFYFENPSELIVLSEDYKRIIYYYSKTLQSFEDKRGRFNYHYTDDRPNRIIVFPSGKELPLSKEEVKRISNRIQEIYDRHCKRGW
jgi:hypothetical protein